MRCARTVNGRAAGGVILVTVLWVLVLLSLIASNLSLGGRSFSRQTLNAELGSRAGLAADAGISWALWSLQQPGSAGWLADGEPHWMPLDDAWIGVALQDESGKLDLNAVPTELLDGLLAAVVEDSRQRAELVAAIEDWRDADDLIRLNGAEREQYQDAGVDFMPGNRPFAALTELYQVLGMTAEIYRQLAPHLTLVTRSRTVNPRVASFEVLMTLPNASAGLVNDYIEQRRDAWREGLPLPELPFDAAPYVSDRRSGVHYRVEVEARLGQTRIRRAARLMRRGAQLQLEPDQRPPDGSRLGEPTEGERT